MHDAKLTVGDSKHQEPRAAGRGGVPIDAGLSWPRHGHTQAKPVYYDVVGAV